MKSQPKHLGVKKVAAENLKKAMLKRCEIKMGGQGPPAVDGIEIFDNDDQASNHYCCLPL